MSSDPPFNFFAKSKLVSAVKKWLVCAKHNPCKTGSVWRFCCTCENGLVFCSAISVCCLYQVLDIHSGTSAVCELVLLACVVDQPRAILWNKTKPINHQLLLQKQILSQILLLWEKYRPGRMTLAELSHYSKIWALCQPPDWCFSYLRIQLTRDILWSVCIQFSSRLLRWEAESYRPKGESGKSYCKQQTLAS